MLHQCSDFNFHLWTAAVFKGKDKAEWEENHFLYCPSSFPIASQSLQPHCHKSSIFFWWKIYINKKRSEMLRRVCCMEAEDCVECPIQSTCMMQEHFRSIGCGSWPGVWRLPVNFCWYCFYKTSQNSVQSGSEPLSALHLSTKAFCEGLERELCVNKFSLLETQFYIMIIATTEHHYPKCKIKFI